MNNNAGSCKLIKFKPCHSVDGNFEMFAEEFFEVTTIDYTDDGLEQLVGYMRLSESVEDLEKAAKEADICLPPYQVECISSQDWLRENVIQFAPVEVAEFLVYGIHEKQVSLHDKIGIKVYAATAFGSEHQTTKSCLEALSDVYHMSGMQHKVLDVGTGSGILAIAAAKLWPQAEVTAVDIDTESVLVARQNATDNNVAKQMAVAFSDGYASETVQKNAPYDVIFANILARPLIAMAEDMAGNLRTGGYAIISGFIEDQVDWVVGEHQKYGLQPLKVYALDNWRAVLLKKDEG